VISPLKETLDSLYATRSRQHLANDPLSFCHRFTAPHDREIAGLIASCLAYGNVKIILRNLQRVFGLIGPSPRRFVEGFDPAEEMLRFAGFKHRFNDGRDLCALFLAVRTMIEEADSIEAFFLAGLSPDEDITAALNRFAAAVLAFDYSPVFGSAEPPGDSYFPFFFPSPASGSACKRLCMYLRWMVRPDDGIDLGVWQGVSPAQLIIPVDAHIQRLGRLLGLTSRKQADWKMAREITASLRILDPADPVKYDFSLCHLGISEGCDGTVRELCQGCPIAGICPRGEDNKNI
jgi:uncharacterized protein (TIGR02757 family)